MSEDEWLGSRAPGVMVAWLEKQMRASRRKMRLFLCGCCRLRCAELQPAVREVLEAAEQAVEHAYYPPMAPAHRRFYDALLAARGAPLSDLDHAVTRLAAWAVHGSGQPAECVGRLAALGPAGRDDRHAGLLRELVGNPFRRVRRVGGRVHHRLTARGGDRRVGDLLLVRDWLTWQDGTVPQLARAIHDERAFDRLGILADALEDAGCTEQALLGHLRAPGPHTRGCWVLDVLLGRE